MKKEVEKIILTLLLRTTPPTPHITADAIRMMIEEAEKFANGELWVRYEPSLRCIIFKVVES